MLFEFPSREIKDAILSNYSGQEAAANPIEQVQEDFEAPEEREAEPQRVLQLLAEQKLSKEEQASLKSGSDEKWTLLKDQTLIENFGAFQDLGAQAYELLSTLVGMSAKLCRERCKTLKILGGELDVAAQKEFSKELIERQNTEDEVTKVVALFKRLVYSLITENSEVTHDKVGQVLDFVAGMMSEYD